MKLYKLLLLALMLIFGITACNNDDDESRTDVTLSYTLPNGISEGSLSNVAVSVTNVSTGKTANIELTELTQTSWTFNVTDGLYTIAFESDLTYSLDNKTVTDKAKGLKESVSIIGGTAEVELELYLSKTGGDFVIAEIFFTGTLTPEGKQYTGDKYYRIFNNSDTILFADGLTILESKFLTTSKEEYTPDIMSQAMAVQAVYRVPGNGTAYPVEPGKSILICDNAQDHTQANSNSFNLTTANFEWYDESSNPNYLDVDNPNITNLDKIYCYTATIWGPHNRGFTSHALGRWPRNLSKETYLADYTYHYEYTFVFNEHSYPMSGDCYKFPNEWIIDAVNLSIEAKHEWIVVDPSLDMGWTYCGTVDSDATRYGKSVRRKTLSTTPSGRIYLKDTNNSTLDFDAEQTANPFYFE